jgi:uncharacterized protein (DUF983 family)
MRKPNPILAGLTGRCPRCGQGPVLDRGLSVRAACPACGQSFAFAENGDGPAVFAIFILGALVLGGALLLEFRVEPPVWVHVVVWGIVTPLLAFGLLRVLKGVLIAVQYANGAGEGRINTSDPPV